MERSEVKYKKVKYRDFTTMNIAFKIHNAIELWQRENSVPSIPSFSHCLDNILGNKGLQLCTLTEVLGLPGTGKTQLCLQLCASVQIPVALEGLNAAALYIDTNTNFTVDRFKEIHSATFLRCQQLLNVSLEMTEEDALKRLHYVNAFGLEKFCAFINSLSRFLAEHRNIKLIVIDSITFPFKDGISAKQRTGLLFRQMAGLQRLAVEKQIAVVVTNEMSTRLGLASGSVTGALGDAWAHRCNTRLLLSTPDDTGPTGDRLAVMLKSNCAADVVARFQITHEGIRDVDQNKKIWTYIV